MILDGCATLGNGFTVTTTFCVLPVHVRLPLVYVGVIVYVISCGVNAELDKFCAMVAPLEAVAPEILAFTDGVQA